MTSDIQFEVFLHPEAETELVKLPNKIRNLIMTKINLLDFPFSMQFKHLEENYYRIRSGNFRVIYQIHFDKKLVVVLKVAHRKNVYKKYKK